MEDAQRREMWAGRIERCLSADMTIKQWCGLNKVWIGNPFLDKFQRVRPAFLNSTGLM